MNRSVSCGPRADHRATGRSVTWGEQVNKQVQRNDEDAAEDGGSFNNRQQENMRAANHARNHVRRGRAISTAASAGLLKRSQSSVDPNAAAIGRAQLPTVRSASARRDSGGSAGSGTGSSPRRKEHRRDLSQNRQHHHQRRRSDLEQRPHPRGRSTIPHNQQMQHIHEKEERRLRRSQSLATIGPPRGRGILEPHQEEEPSSAGAGALVTAGSHHITNNNNSPAVLNLYHVSQPEPRARWVFNLSTQNNKSRGGGGESPAGVVQDRVTSTIDNTRPNLGGLVWVNATLGGHCCLQRGSKTKAVTDVPASVLDGWLNGQSGYWWLGALKEGHRALWDSHVVMSWAMVFIPAFPEVSNC